VKPASVVIALLALGLPLAPLTLRAQDDEASRLREGVRAELSSTYRSRASELPPSVEKAFAELSSGDAATRHVGGQRLLVLLETLFEDESNGRAPWLATPFWGGGSENPARQLRPKIADAIGSKAPRREELVPALTWLVFEERLLEPQVRAAEILREVPGEAATALLEKIVAAPHPVGAVLAVSAEELAKRSPERALGPLRRLANHHRTNVRAVARGFLEERGEKLAPFEPAAALEALRPTLAAVSSLAPLPVGPAAFVSVKLARAGEAGKTVEYELRGFELPGARAGAYRLLTTHLEEITVDRKTPLSDDDRTVVPLADEARRIVAIRAEALKGDRDAADRLSKRGGLTGQFEPRSLSGYEVFLASVCLERGDAPSAAALILPPADAVGDDRWILEIVRDQWGTALFHRILELFAGDRDYEAAAKLAEHVRAHFEGLNVLPSVEKLARELPLRRDEFHTFTLPRPEEWEAKKKTLSRLEQIDFLCDHLRLLNCFQRGQPGGVDFGGQQYAEPCGLVDAAWQGHKGETELVNPLTELEKLKLDVADVPALVPHLLDDRTLPTVGFWRDFHPARTLYTVNEVVGWLIDAIAHQPLAQVGKLATLDEAGKRAHLASIVEWAEKNATRSEKDRLLDVLSKDQSWYAAERLVVKEIVEKKISEAVPIILRYLERADTNEYNRESILHACRELDGAQAVAAVTSYLHDPKPAVKIEAGILAFHWGDRDAGRRALREAVVEGNHGNLSCHTAADAIRELLSTGAPEDWDAAKAVFGRDYFTTAWSGERLAIARLFGDRDAFAARFYLKQLDAPGERSYWQGDKSWKEPFGFDFAKEAIDCFGPDRVGLKWREDGTRAEKDADFARVRAWLEKEVARSKKSWQ
jgi:hypothetical protein